MAETTSTTIGIVGLEEGGVDARIRRGIADYRTTRRRWRIVDGKHDRSYLNRVLAAEPSGIIAHVTDRGFVRQLQALKIPVVNLSHVLAETPFPLVASDDLAAGRMAAEHFAERQFPHFAYYGGAEGFHFGTLRWEGFSMASGESGGQALRYDHPEVKLPRAIDRAQARRRHLEQWLAGLPAPCGLMLEHDHLGEAILDAADHAGRRIPEELAVLSVDDADVICETLHPPLASVRPAAEGIGFQAAALLDRLMAGKAPECAKTLIPPLGVTLRQSGDVFAVSDELLREALRWIDRHAHERIGVAEVVRTVGCDRRRLERLFRRHLGRTPLQEIHRVQVGIAREELVRTALAMGEIALQSGFRDNTHMGIIFKRVTGMSPTGYRRANRRPMR